MTAPIDRNQVAAKMAELETLKQTHQTLVQAVQSRREQLAALQELPHPLARALVEFNKTRVETNMQLAAVSDRVHKAFEETLTRAVAGAEALDLQVPLAEVTSLQQTVEDLRRKIDGLQQQLKTSEAQVGRYRVDAKKALELIPERFVKRVNRLLSRERGSLAASLDQLRGKARLSESDRDLLVEFARSVILQSRDQALLRTSLRARAASDGVRSVLDEIGDMESDGTMDAAELMASLLPVPPAEQEQAVVIETRPEEAAPIEPEPEPEPEHKETAELASIG